MINSCWMESDYSENAPGDLIDTGQEIYAYRPDPLPPDLDVEITGELHKRSVDAMYHLGRLREIGERVDDYRIIRAPFIYREAVDSSEIEGTQITLQDIYTHEATQAQSERSPASDTEDTKKAELQEVQNYIESTRRGIERLESGEEISLELLKNLHKILLGRGEVRGENQLTGEFRDDYVHIGPVKGNTPRFVPCPPRDIEQSMKSLENYIQHDGPIDDLIDIGLVHYQIETIHPFMDGNGRVGRLLITLMLYDRGILPQPYLHPSSYIKQRKQKYVDKLLAVSQNGFWLEWLEFFLDMLRKQAEEACVRAKLLLDLRDEYAKRYSEGSDSVQKLSIKLFSHPVITVRYAESLLGCTYSTANKAVQELKKDGVLIEVTGNSRNRRFHAEEILDVIRKDPGSIL